MLLVAQTADLPSALAKLATIDLRLLLLPAVVVVVQMWLRAIRWGLLLTAIGPVRLGASRVFWPLTAGYLASIVLFARLGELVRIVIITRKEGVPATVSTASVVVERAVDLLALLAVVAVAFGVVGSIGWLPLVGMLLLLVMFGLVLRAAGWMAGHLPAQLPRRARDVAARLLLAFDAARPKVVVRVWLVSLVAWCFDALVMWLCAQALGFPVSPGVAILISSGAALGAVLPAAAAALGTYELGAVALAGTVGVSADQALQVALLAHLVGIVTVLILGAVGAVVVSVTPARSQVARELAPRGDAITPAPNQAL